MFARFTRFFTRPTARRITAAVAVITAVGSLTPLALAGEPGWGRRGHDTRESRDGGDHGGPRFSIDVGLVLRPPVLFDRRPDVVVVDRRPAPCPPPRVEVAPCDIQFHAYQSEDRVILNIEGRNRSEGFTTSVRACDTRGYSPTIDLCNLAPAERCGQREMPFCITTSLGSRRALSSLTVRVAGATYTVPVMQTVSLN